MPFAIGLRFYRITIRPKGSTDPLEMGPNCEPCDFLDFAEKFVGQKTEPTIEEGDQRTWYFEPVATNSIRSVHGYINYGTHGFESKFKDVKTRKAKYDRQATDLEEIPLYFQVWAPSSSNSALMAFQSFQGRSCVNYVRVAMIRQFQDNFPGYQLSFRVLAPGAAILDDAPVKSVTFSNPRKVSDVADTYMFGKQIDELDYDLTVKAKKRGGILSRYKDLKDSYVAADGFVEFDGREFENISAEVKMGLKRRTVSIFGSGIDAGLIDVSENVTRDKSGHPSFKSIASEVDQLMETFFAGIKT